MSLSQSPRNENNRKIPGEWIENLTLAQTRERLKHNVSTFEEMLQEKALSESNVHLYIDMKHTEIVRPVLHAVMQAVDRWGWTADRLVVATFRQLDLLQVSRNFNTTTTEICWVRCSAPASRGCRSEI